MKTQSPSLVNVHVCTFCIVVDMETAFILGPNTSVFLGAIIAGKEYLDVLESLLFLQLE
jgi:hypothetical protein